MDRDVLLSRFRPWINAAAVAAVFAVIAALVLACPPEDLLFTHLAVGDQILAKHVPPPYEEFSYTAYGNPWTDIPWLYQAVIARLRRAGGLGAVGAAHALLWVGLFAWLFRSVGRGIAVWTRAGIVLLAAVACGPWLRPGPEAVSAALLPASLALLGSAVEAAAARQRRRVLWGALPLLVLAGANLDERILLTLVATALFAVDRLMAATLRWARSSEEAAPAFVAAADAAVSLGLQCGAALVNPFGARALRWMFEIVLDPRGALVNLRSLSDDVRPILSGGLPLPVQYAAGGLAVVALLLLLFRPGGTRLFEAAFLLILGVLALRTRGDLPPFLLTAAFLSLRRLGSRPDTGAATPGAPDRVAGPRRWRAAPAALGAGACVVVAAWATLEAVRPTAWPPRTRPIPAFRSQVDEEPVQAARFIGRSGLPGQVFHSFSIGGYLLDAWARDRRIFVDSRRQPFEHGVLATYVEIVADPEAFERAADKYQVTAVVWPHRDARAGARLLRHLAAPGRWALGAIDTVASVWVRADALSPAIVAESPLQPGQRLASAVPALLAEIEARPRRGPPVREAAIGEFFAATGDQASGELCFRRAIERAPDAAPLWIRLGETLEARGDRDGARLAFGTAAGLDHGSGEAQAALGRLALETGDLDEAEQRLDAAARSGDDRPSTLVARARLEARRGRLAEARRLFAAALREGHDRDVLVAAARFEGESGALEAALDLYARARARRPDDPVVAADSALLLEAAGRFGEALEIARGPAEGARARSAASGGATAEDRRLLEVAARVARRTGEEARAGEWEKAIGASGPVPEEKPPTPER